MTRVTYPTAASDTPLSEREQHILRLVVESFVDTAGPIGSRFLARRYPLGLSAASIRNTMSDLESLGYLDHPYTSAGRVPTELGYRTFVDSLMEIEALSAEERERLTAHLRRVRGDAETLVRESARLLGKLSNLLGVVLTPKLSKGVLERLEVVPLSSTRVMFVLSVRGGLLRTIVLELNANLKRRELERIVSLLNERLAGLTLEEIRRTYAHRIRDLDAEDRTGLVRLVLNASDDLFSEKPDASRVTYGGTQSLMQQPEFQESERLRNLITLLESEDVVVQLLEPGGSDDTMFHASVAIGQENEPENARRYSIVSAPYRYNDTFGTIGVIGPMRMDYRRVIGLVEGMAALMSVPLSPPHH